MRACILAGLSAAILIALTPLPAWSQDEPPVDRATIKKAIAAGVEFLKKGQHPNGLWNPYAGGSPDQPVYHLDIGVTALAGLALLESDVPKDDPVIQRTATALRRLSPELKDTYLISLNVMFLDRLGEPKDKDLIQKLAMRLVAGGKGGGWGYECPILTNQQHAELWNAAGLARSKPKGRVVVPEVPQLDNSNTQFAILALWIARRHGVPVEPTLWVVEQRFRNTQQKDGHWLYREPEEEGTPAMTCAGLLGLAIGHGVYKELREANLRPKATDGKKEPEPKPEPEADRPDLMKDKAVAAALEYLGPHVGKPKPGSADRPPLYFMWSLERVAVIYGWKTIDGKDWYAWGSDLLVKAQGSDGSWTDQHPPAVDTAFALLFLKQANLAADLTPFIKGKADLVPSGTGTKPPVEPVNPKGLPPKEADAAQLGADLASPNGTGKEAIVQKLRDGKGSDYTEALAQAIPKLSGTVRDEARKALADRLAHLSTKALRERLASDDGEVRRAAATACGLREMREHVPDLIPMLSDKDPTVANSAYEALKKLTGLDLGRQPGRWQEWWDKQ